MDGGKDASCDDLPLDFGEPDFDLVKPGRVSGGKMKVDLGMLGQKLLDEFGFMGREIINDDMNLASEGLGGHDIGKKVDELGAGRHERSCQGFLRFGYQEQRKEKGFRDGNTQNHEPRPCLEKGAEQDPDGPRLG